MVFNICNLALVMGNDINTLCLKLKNKSPKLPMKTLCSNFFQMGHMSIQSSTV